ncbi:MAG: tRNA (adenosine(37)-N6)-threonylcarbamoyltransferase complex dimerization subunit type 1 TsaB [Verrucomicrobiae bacterium]|nr:tRNA (adenosine(37)-N6)-threonylcarbamoyltransferase complex dimerization subunit type 1 TsaB [Verrucomicrobiae bacterium]
MTGVAIEISSSQGGVALLRGDGPVREEIFPSHRNHACEIFPALERLGVEPKNTDFWAVGLGPGSFTGIRAALASLKGLNLPFQKPVYGLNSHDILAGEMAATGKITAPTLAVLSDARRGEFYVTAYAWLEGELTKVNDTAILAPSQLPRKFFGSTQIVGPDLEPSREVLMTALPRAHWTDEICFPTASRTLRMAHKLRLHGNAPAETLEPIYLRDMQYVKCVVR